jgi:hypothetical protein
LAGLFVKAFAISNTTLFAGTGDGVYSSNDNGQNWTKVSTGLPQSPNIREVLAVGSNLFLGTGGDGVFLSSNQLIMVKPGPQLMWVLQIFELIQLLQPARRFLSALSEAVFFAPLTMGKAGRKSIQGLVL